jgi:hypothetical protein
VLLCVSYFFQFGFGKGCGVIHHRIADQEFSVFFSVNYEIVSVEVEFIFFRKISKLKTPT